MAAYSGCSGEIARNRPGTAQGKQSGGAAGDSRKRATRVKPLTASTPWQGEGPSKTAPNSLSGTNPPAHTASGARRRQPTEGRERWKPAGARWPRQLDTRLRGPEG